MSCPSWITNPFLKTHLKYVYNTESPVIMHVWAAIGAASAAMGRHVWLETGIKKMYPNAYILLVGPPGVRKNSAINCAVDLLRDATGVKFAPDDTGGQRQGLIVALEDSDKDSITDQGEGIDLSNIGDMAATLETLGSINLGSPIKDENPDKHVLFICATEFGSFLGQGSIEMTRFLIKMWDGEDYKYKLRKEFNIVKHPLLSLLGGTTSNDLAMLMPDEAIGTGFMSRIVFVHAARREKRLPPSKSFTDKKYTSELKAVYRWLFSSLKGAMIQAPDAAQKLDDIYMEEIQIKDTRFVHYSERRQDHLTKLAMVLAGTRKSSVIQMQDVLQASAILIETEKTMSDALGEYGLSPLAVSKQKLLEFVQSSKSPVPYTMLWMMLRNDMRQLDFRNAVTELQNANKLIMVQLDNGDNALVYKEDFHEIQNLLTK